MSRQHGWLSCMEKRWHEGRKKRKREDWICWRCQAQALKTQWRGYADDAPRATLHDFFTPFSQSTQQDESSSSIRREWVGRQRGRAETIHRGFQNESDDWGARPSPKENKAAIEDLEEADVVNEDLTVMWFAGGYRDPAWVDAALPHGWKAPATLIVQEGPEGALKEDKVFKGDFMGFPAGKRIAHALRAGKDELTYLVGGTRQATDVCTYPAMDKRLVVDRAANDAWLVEEQHVTQFWVCDNCMVSVFVSETKPCILEVNIRMPVV